MNGGLGATGPDSGGPDSNSAQGIGAQGDGAQGGRAPGADSRGDSASERSGSTRRPKSPWGGQCPQCRHVKLLESDRGSVFVMCRRASEDPRLRKYPPQPQLTCRAFERDTP